MSPPVISTLPDVEPAHPRDLERVLEKVRTRLLAVLYRRGVLHHDAEDLAQDALGQVWLHLPGLREPERVAAWATKIVLNRLCSVRRRAKFSVGLDESLRAEVQDPLEAAMRSESKACVSKALDALRPEHRAPLVLRHGVGFSPETTCNVLGISRETLRRRLNAGLVVVRKRLGVRSARLRDARSLRPAG